MDRAATVIGIASILLFFAVMVVGGIVWSPRIGVLAAQPFAIISVVCRIVVS